jgi:hypothetical protein
VPSGDPGASSLAQQLLDAQVAYHLDRLSGDRLAPWLTVVVDDVLAGADRHPIEDLADREAIRAIVVRVVGTVPGSPAVTGIIEMATEIAYAGPEQHYPWGELVDRGQVEELVDALLVLAAGPAVERALERLTGVPQVGTGASRFIRRIVTEVMQANQAAANRVPGLGSLVSFGTDAATRMMGAADKQLESVLGRGLDQGGVFAVRLLNRILVETLREPGTRETVLQVWDLVEQEPVAGLSEYGSRAEIDDVVGAAHALATSALATGHAAELAARLVDGFFDRFGGHTPTELLDELDIGRDGLVADLVRVAPQVIEALRETGDLERIIRAQLEPFYTSAEVAALLG